MDIKQFSTEFKKELQKDLLKAYKGGTRILDMLLEYQRIYQLEWDDIKKILNKNLKEKMFEQEKHYKTVVTKRTKKLVKKQKTRKYTKIDLDD